MGGYGGWGRDRRSGGGGTGRIGGWHCSSNSVNREGAFSCVKEIESFSSGWRTALADLRLYLTHFAGQHAAPITAASTSAGRSRDDVWAQLTGALGVPADPSPGDRIEASAEGATTLAGTVQESEPGIVTLLLDAPAPGLALIAAGGPAETVFTFVRAHLFGPDAPAIATRDEPAWQAWLREQFATR
jgi:hypothetical protein